ncbi:MAG TPA: hypothetical protein VGF56_15080 [Rhizomicrobium sp.]|jgi:hypothetical protein
MDEDEARYRRSLFGLIAAVVVVALGIWLAHALYENLQHERCVEERRVCDPIATDPGQ